MGVNEVSGGKGVISLYRKLFRHLALQLAFIAEAEVVCDKLLSIG